MRVGRVMACSLVVVVSCARPVAPPAPPVPEAKPRAAVETFSATAYSIEGRTASGARTRRGIVAADPRILPIGSRIRVHDAGPYSGEYVVRDTGAGIKGREIDIYLPDDAEAKRFGRRAVKVEVLSRGE
jgi:3D (Asp-Asp-Asp) domain-containing protein